MINNSEQCPWAEIGKYIAELKKRTIKDLFLAGNRFNEYSIENEHFLFDYSKNYIDDKLMSLFVNMAEKAKLREAIEAMFSGEKINNTEKRAVLHTALRDISDTELMLDGEEIKAKIAAVRNKMKDFAQRVHSGAFCGYTGRKLTHIVNIGIGGSDLGPAMVCKALRKYAVDGIHIHFVSNVDSTDLAENLKGLNPETTLFIIASKTFTTQETIRNAESAKSWFLSKTNGDTANIAMHFVALSTNKEAVERFGIDSANMFEFWDWVGGRYSLWSAIGLSIALYVGYDNFEKLLAGAYYMDKHFRTAPFEKNIPFIMAALGILYTDFMGAESHAVIPYEQYLERFPAFLQQLDMESNGKSTNKQGGKILPNHYKTGAIIWGEPGTNAQHSFFQLIHQGTRLIPVDFLAGVNSLNEIENHQSMLLSNCLAQSEALMNGKDEATVRRELEAKGMSQSEIEELLPHKLFEGNRPSNTILYKKLTPEVLGMLIAMYEHKVFVQGVLWNVNSFDQWGVELGKELASKILPELSSDGEITSHDDSTNGLINYFKRNRTNIM